MGTEPLEFCAAARLENNRAREENEICIFVDLVWLLRVDVASGELDFDFGRESVLRCTTVK